jgi:hypothetical protein
MPEPDDPRRQFNRLLRIARTGWMLGRRHWTVGENTADFGA